MWTESVSLDFRIGTVQSLTITCANPHNNTIPHFLLFFCLEELGLEYPQSTLGKNIYQMFLKIKIDHMCNFYSMIKVLQKYSLPFLPLTFSFESQIVIKINIILKQLSDSTKSFLSTANVSFLKQEYLHPLQKIQKIFPNRQTLLESYVLQGFQPCYAQLNSENNS